MSELEKALPLGHPWTPGLYGRCAFRECWAVESAHLPAEPALLERCKNPEHTLPLDHLHGVCIPPGPVAQDSEHVDVFARTLQRECFSSDGADIGKAVQMIAAHDAATHRESEAQIDGLVKEVRRLDAYIAREKLAEAHEESKKREALVQELLGALKLWNKGCRVEEMMDRNRAGCRCFGCLTQRAIAAAERLSER